MDATLAKTLTGLATKNAAKVAAYWSEFAKNGKEFITARQQLGPQAALCIIDEPLAARVLLADLDAIASILIQKG